MGRTSIILGGVALVLLGFILVFERGSVSTRERDERKGKILDAFVRDRVSRIEIQRKGVTTVLVRDDAKGDVPTEASFRVMAPYAAEADREAVESLLAALEWITPRRSLGEASAQDRTQFGFDKPRFRVSFEAGHDRGAFSIGAPSNDAAGAYLQTSNDKRTYVVGQDLVEALDHEPDYFHTKTLHKGVSAYSVDKLRIRDAQGEHLIEKRGELYWLQRPEPALASEPVLTEVVEALDALKASRFVIEKPASLDTYGLSSPSLLLAVDSRSFDDNQTKKYEGKPEHLELRIGSACKGHEAESYVRADEGPVMCATDADLAKLKKSAAELRETRLCVLNDGEIRSVDLRAGKRQLRVEQTDDGHKYRVLEDGKERESGTVDETALSDWLKSLRGATAVAFEDDPTQTVGPVAVAMTFERGKDKAPYEVRVGRTQGDRVAVSRAGEKSFAWFGKNVLPLVSASAVKFRKPRVLDVDPGTFSKLTLSGAGRAEEVVVKQGERYLLEQPRAAAGEQAERPTVEEIARLVSKLDAVRFIADAPAPEHGLAQPAYVVRIDYTGKTPGTHTLKLGAATDGGRFAQLDAEPAVFIAAPALVRQLEGPLVSRSALAVPLEQLAGLEGRQDLAKSIATLRASQAVHYGKALPDEGFDKPQLKLALQPAQGASWHGRTLLFGRPVGPEPTADIYARRTDLDVTFTVPRSALEALGEAQPTAATPRKERPSAAEQPTPNH
jgi:hypothetical protein